MTESPQPTSLERGRDILVMILQIGLAALFLVPFIYTGSTTFPFIVGKVIALRVVVEILVAAAALLLAFDPERRPRKSWILLLLGGWVVSLLLSTVFGVDPDRSFWGNHERMTGVFTLLHFALISVLSVIALPTQVSWRRFWGWGIITSAAMAVVGFVQYFSPTGLLHTAGGGRIWATLGNYIYLAQYSLFFMFLALWFAVSGPRRNRPLALVVAAMQGVILLLSETRGALLGAFVGVIILGVWMTRLPGDERVRRRWMAGFLAVLVLAAAVWFARGSSVVHAIPGLRRVSEISLVAGGAPTRLIAWSIALEAFRARPAFGWGIENYYYAFNRYYHPESLRYSYYETWFDRAHNAFLDLLSLQGVVGTIATLALYAGMFAVYARHRKRGREAYIEAAFVSAILGSYLAQSFFVFDSPSSYLLFFLLVGWAIRLEWGYRQPVAGPAAAMPRPAPFRLAAAGAVALFMLVLIFSFNIQTLRANHLGLLGSAELQAGNLAAGLEHYQAAIAVPNPLVRDLRTDLARDISENIMNPNVPADAALQAWRVAVSELEKNIELRPKDAYDRILLGQLYNQGSSFDTEALAKADRVLTAAIPLSPKRQQIFYTLAKTKLLLGKPEEAREMLEQTVAWEPNIPDSHWYLGLILYDSGNVPGAWAEILKAMELGYQWKSPMETLFTAEVAKNVGDARMQAALLEQVAPYFGQVGEFHARLAEAYGAAGEIEKAQEESVRAVYLDESLKERMQELLKMIGS